MKPETAEESSILILADGRLLARNVTAAIAEVLLALQPDNQELAVRAESFLPLPLPLNPDHGEKRKRKTPLKLSQTP